VVRVSSFALKIAEKDSEFRSRIILALDREKQIADLLSRAKDLSVRVRGAKRADRPHVGFLRNLVGVLYRLDELALSGLGISDSVQSSEDAIYTYLQDLDLPEWDDLIQDHSRKVMRRR